MDREVEELWRSGYIVTTKVGTIAGGTYKCNFDVEITMDILKAVYQVKPEIIVLASGDSDFVSLIQEVRKSGVRVEVAAFEETAGTDVVNKCSGFIDLAVYYEGYLAAQNGDEDSTDEKYKDLIQSQQDEQSEDGTAAADKDLLHLQESDLDEDVVKIPVDELDRQIQVPAPDIIDDLEI